MGAEIDRLEIEVEAAAAKANRELDKLLNRLEKISGSLSKIDTEKLSGFSIGLDKYTSKSSTASRETERISKSFVNLSKRITGSGKSFAQMAGSFYANSFLIIRGLKQLRSSIESSMDYVETYNYFSVTMDKIGREFGKDFDQYGYDSADAYANSFKDRLNELTRKMTGYNVGSDGELFATDSIGLGLDPQVVQNYQASISAITNSVGLIGENSVNASKALTMLAADMSSLKNVDLSTVMTNLQSGLIGQSRALYKYGIDITNATLQTYAYKYGLSMAVSEMTQADKMQLRLLAILDQSRVAWGDQANTINSVANQYRILKQQVSNLARVIGNLFLPIVQKVLPVVNGLVIALQRLFTALGFKLWGGNWLKDTMDGISGIGGDALGDLADSADDTADGLKDAGKAAEKLKTSVLGIDELNIVRSDDSSGSGSSTGSIGSGIDLSGAIGDALAEYESVWEEAFKNAENKAQEFADKICGFFGRIWTAIEPFRNALKKLWDEGLSLLMGYTFQNLLDFYNLFLVPIGKWAFGTEDSGLTRLVNIINERLMQIDWVWISDNLRKFWKAIEPYAEQFGEGLIDFFEDISKIPVSIINAIFGREGAIKGLTDWLENHDPETARKWGYALGVLATGIFALSGVATVISGIAGIGAAISGIVSGLSELFGSSGIFATISGGIGKLFGDAGISSLLTQITPATAALTVLAAGLSYVFATNEEVRNSFLGAVDTLKNGLQPVLQFLTEKLMPDLNSAWERFLEILAPIGEFLENVFVSIWQEIINPALNTLGEEILPLLTESLENLWNNTLVPLGELLGDVFAPVIESLSWGLNVLWQSIILPLAKAISTVFMDSIKAIIEIFNKYTEKVDLVIEVLKYMWNDVMMPIAKYLTDTFKPVFEKVFGVIKELIDNLGLALSGLIEFITGIFTDDWEKAWNGVKDIFKGIFNGIISIVEYAINRIIDGLNGFIQGFNGIVTKVGDIIGIDIELPVIHSVSLPRFEQGGYPETGQLFLARENGINEMVGHIGNKPAVANNDQIVESVKYGVRQGVADAVSEILAPYLSDIAQNTRETADKDFTVNIGDREISRANERGRSDRGYVLIT